MSENIVSLSGIKGPPVVKEPHQGVINLLERLLQDARAGEIVGMAVTYQAADWRAGYSVVGFVGGFSMVGAAYNILQEVADLNRGLTDGDEDE